MKRSSLTFSLAVLLASSLLPACDDDDPTPPPQADAGKPDAAGDAGAPDTAAPNLDVAKDTVAEVAAEAGAETGDAGPVLTPQQARGSYLVNVVIGCPECHTPRLPTGQLDLTMFMAGETTPAPGCIFKAPNDDCVHPRNLTNHETGLKNRTDAEIKKMFLEGKRPAPTGEEALSPVMPYYLLHNMNADDADAIVAYLRTLPGIKNEIPRRGMFWDLPQPVPALNLAKVPQPAPTYPNLAAAERGKYLATQTGLCIECHSEHLRMGPTALNEDKLFQGGEDFTGVLGPNFPFPIRSKNITPDVTTGVGMWTQAELVRALKMGLDKAGKGICPPMPSGMAGYARLTDDDADAIAHYLLSIPPAANMVPDMCTFPPGP
jgi:hypothetical protein